jgi:hypothetical protein
MCRALLPACICFALLAAGCGEPPNKEMDQAQGAIDAARAAGADRYAPAEFSAATDALARSRDAVTQRDYRLALDGALESRERAQNAAREAADTRARLGGEAERLLTEVAALIEQAEKSLGVAERARQPQRVLRAHQEAVAAARGLLQEARAAVSAGDYTAATTALSGTKEKMAGVITAVDALASPQTSRRRR